MTNDNPQGLGDWQSSGFKRLTILRVWETDNPQGLGDWQSSGFGRLTILRVRETDNPRGLGDWQSSGLGRLTILRGGRLTILSFWETDMPTFFLCGRYSTHYLLQPWCCQSGTWVNSHLLFVLVLGNVFLFGDLHKWFSDWLPYKGDAKRL